MTRVLQVLARSAGGMAKHVAQVTAALDGSDGLTIDIAAPIDLPVALPKTPIPLDIPRGPIVGHRRVVGELAELLASYDVVHAHGLRAGMDAGLAARRARKRSFLTVHNLVQTEIAGRLRAPFYRRAETAAVWANDHTFAVSREIARHLGAEGKVEVLYLGIGDPPEVVRPAAEVRAELGLDREQKLIVSVARLVPQKSLDVMLRAMELLAPENVLALLGEGRLRPELEALSRSAGLGERVHFLGFRPDAPDWLAAADVFCLSSIWEGIPLSAQEAILLGTPVVATDVGGMRELISNKVSGRLVPPKDPHALAAALGDVLADPERAAGYAMAARDRVREVFSTERMLDRLKAAYVG